MALSGFRRTASGRITVRTDALERVLLMRLLRQLGEFVAPDPTATQDPLAQLVGIDAEAHKPRDPALARLFPDAYTDDPGAADDFRRFTERSLREGKAAHVNTALASLERSGDKLTLTQDEARAWLGTLNDLRLTLGARLGVDAGNADLLATLPEEDPRAALGQVYDWLTYLQGTLVRALMR